MRSNKTLVLWFLLIALFFLLLSPMVAAQDENYGKQIYERYCSTCHESSYANEGIWYPRLQEIVARTEPEDIVRMIDNGQFRRAGDTAAGSHPSHTVPFMPAWSWLSDAELAALVNFLLAASVDSSMSVSEAEVRAIRNPGTDITLSDIERNAANQIYLSHCAGCHGTQREGVVGPPLSRWPLETRSMEEIRAVLHYGTLDGMPEWGVSVRLSANQMTLLARYLQEPPITETPTFDLGAISASWQPAEDKSNGSRLAKTYLLSLLHDARRAVFVDTAKQKVVAQTRLDFAPYDVLQDDTLSILSREGWISQIDPSTKEVVAQVRAGYEPAMMAIVPQTESRDKVLAVTTVSPPGVSFFEASSLKPIDRVETSEPMGVIIGKQSAIAILTRLSGCIYPLDGLVLADQCIPGVPYPRYATQVPDTQYHLVVGETGQVAVYDELTREVIARVNLGNRVTPSQGTFVHNKKHGQVFLVASMTSSGVAVIGADPDSESRLAWQLIDTIDVPTQGALFMAGHKRSDLVVVDSPVSLSDAGSVHLFNKHTLATTELDVAQSIGIKGTPRVLQPIFDRAGNNVWLTVWNRLDEKSALVALDADTGEIQSVIEDSALTTPIRSFWVRAN